MTTDEQLWFAVGIAGFVIFMEAAISYFLYKISKGKIPTQLSRIIAGLFLLAYAIYKLFNIPSGN